MPPPPRPRPTQPAKLRTSAACLTAVWAALTPAFAAPPSPGLPAVRGKTAPSAYSLSNLGGRDLHNAAISINDRGEVLVDLGFSDFTITDLFRKVYKNGRYSYAEVNYLPPNAGNVPITGVALNAVGDVLGKEALCSGGKFIELTLPGKTVEASGINAWKQVVGSYFGAFPDYGPHRPFLRQPDGRLIDLGTFGYASAEAIAINDLGQILIQARDAQGGQHTLLTAPGGGKPREIGTDDLEVTPASLNDLGQVVAWAFRNPYVQHAYLFDGIKLRDLGTLPGATDSVALGINNRGEVVGYSHFPDAANADDYYHAWVYKDGRLRDLTPLVQSTNPGWTVSYAFAINDLGEIAGSGNQREDFGEPDDYAVVLHPVP